MPRAAAVICSSSRSRSRSSSRSRSRSPPAARPAAAAAAGGRPGRVRQRTAAGQAQDDERAAQLAQGADLDRRDVAACRLAARTYEESVPEIEDGPPVFTAAQIKVVRRVKKRVSVMTVVLKCNNCAKSDEANEQDEDDEAEDASWLPVLEEVESARHVIEFQSRGAIHFHVDPFIPLDPMMMYIACYVAKRGLDHESNTQVQP